MIVKPTLILNLSLVLIASLAANHRAYAKEFEVYYLGGQTRNQYQGQVKHEQGFHNHFLPEVSICLNPNQLGSDFTMPTNPRARRGDRVLNFDVQRKTATNLKGQSRLSDFKNIKAKPPEQPWLNPPNLATSFHQHQAKAQHHQRDTRRFRNNCRCRSSRALLKSSCLECDNKVARIELGVAIPIASRPS